MATPNEKNLYLSLDTSNAAASISLLQTTLANTIFMQSLYKKYHWHVQGKDFYEYHLLFDKHADEQLPLIDTIAERIQTLGGTAEGMPAEVAQNSSLKESTDPGHDCQVMVQNVLVAHEAYIDQVRTAADASQKNNDARTNDLLVSEALRLHELQVWFIRSSLKH